jgi:hypothetical protein
LASSNPLRPPTIREWWPQCPAPPRQSRPP